MQLSDLQTLVATLCNDPSNARYQTTDINQELNNTQRQWNGEIGINKRSGTITVVNGQRQYPLFTLITGTPVSFTRVTHKGIDLKKRSKTYFDLYTGTDWTQAIGTPTDYFIEFENTANVQDQSDKYITLYPIPQSNDVGANLVVEFVADVSDMSGGTDLPFTTGQFSNYFTLPYHFYIAYSAAARLLARDPSPENQVRAGQYLVIAGQGKELLINIFKNLEAEEPIRLRGGRQW